MVCTHQMPAVHDGVESFMTLETVRFGIRSTEADQSEVYDALIDVTSIELSVMEQVSGEDQVRSQGCHL